jgi:hypothetical protein
LSDLTLFRPMRIAFFSLCAFALPACGGGGSDGGSNGATSSTTSTSTLSGSVVKGPVAGSQVCAYELVATGKGRPLGCTISNADGAYSLDLTFQGEVVVEAAGGTYTDEATGLAGVALSTPLTSAALLGSGPNTLHATPLTALAYSHAVDASGDFTLAGFEANAGLVRNAFGLPETVDLTRTLPIVNATSINAYGTALEGISKMLGMGATLAGLMENANLDALKASYSAMSQCISPLAESLLPPALSLPINAHGHLCSNMVQLTASGLPQSSGSVQLTSGGTLTTSGGGINLSGPSEGLSGGSISVATGGALVVTTTPPLDPSVTLSATTSP